MLTVGFDLDMTLIDSRAGIGAVWSVLAAETGVSIDVSAVVERLGPPLEEELGRWFSAADVPGLADRFRALYPELAIEPTILLPGARDAVDAVRRHDGRVVVITAKYELNARLHIDTLGLEVDEVVGWQWGPAKAAALQAHAANMYVGDHVSDVLGARLAGVTSVAVATGPASVVELRQAGADLVLDDLTSFPAWFDEFVGRKANPVQGPWPGVLGWE